MYIRQRQESTNIGLHNLWVVQDVNSSICRKGFRSTSPTTARSVGQNYLTHDCSGRDVAYVSYYKHQGIWWQKQKKEGEENASCNIVRLQFGRYFCPWFTIHFSEMDASTCRNAADTMALGQVSVTALPCVVCRYHSTSAQRLYFIYLPLLL